MKKDLRYLHLASGDDLPTLPDSQPFTAILIIETECHQPWQWEVCRWLVASGCRCVMAWGQDCVSWEAAVEDALEEAHDYDEIPEEQCLIITSHEDEELADVFWYQQHKANHPAVALASTLIVHVADAPDRDRLEAAYRRV